MGKGKKKGANEPKKAPKIVEDKTFGLKNKKKSAKVQKYIQQVNKQNAQSKNNPEYQKAQAAKKKAEKEAKKQAEREMFELLGDAYIPGKKKNLTKKTRKKLDEKEKEKKAKEEEKKRAAHERDFKIPIVSLKDVFQLDAKAIVPRVCAVMEHKDNLVSKGPDGKPCIFIKITDGSTMNPIPVMIAGETPTSFEIKVNTVVDIRNVVAMVRGEKVFLEFSKDDKEASITSASPELTEYIMNIKQENDEIRAQGGIPIEQLIEEQRAALDSDKLTPVTKERFFEWKKKKRLKQEAEWEEKRKEAAKKGGKGLNVLTGKALFAYDASLFKDDEAAFNDKDYDAEEDDANPEKADAKAPAAPVDDVTAKLQQDLYLEGDDDDLDDLDDLDD